MRIKERKKLRDFVSKLALIRGRHTELVSVYIPTGYDIQKIINHLQQEQGTASNIKDARTRKHVKDSLEKIIRHLRLYRKTPVNGLAAFSGNTSQQEGKVDIEVFSIEPPEPITTRLYRCDHTFVLDILKNMMEHKEVFGLIAIDKREATLGLLKGTSIQKLTKLTSGVPGKIKAGGQCCLPNTLIQSYDGEILEISNSHNPYKLSSTNMNNYSIIDSAIIDKWNTKKSKVYRIITKNPRFEVNTSKDHMFFVSTNEGIVEKPAEELKINDQLIIPEKIKVKTRIQKLGSLELNEDLAQIIGYFLGDGSYEIDRLNFYEGNEQLANFYKNKLEKVFKIKPKMNFRKSKNYFLTRLYSRKIVKLFKKNLPEIKKALICETPLKILKSPNKIVASFLRGLYDAEGFVSKSSNRIGIAMYSKKIMQQIQLILLRFGILASLLEYDNKRNPYSNNMRYTLEISEKESIKLFKENINFNSKHKKENLNYVLKNKSNRSYVRQIIVSGIKIRKIIEEAGYNTNLFPKVTNFFRNERKMSKQTFKNSILNYIKDKRLHKELKKIYNYNILPVQISKIEIINKPTEMVDISVKNQNFIANGILVHNSAARFARIREGAAKEFYKRIADAANKEFLGKKNLKGILIGGPGHSKEEFVEYLNQQLKDKILGLKDITYTDEQGLHDLVDKSQDTLAKEVIAEEKAIMQKFFNLLAKEPNKVTYGLEEVKKALNYSAVEILLISEDLDEKLVEELEAKAEAIKAEVQMISLETREGSQLKDLSGIAAILRFAIE